MRCAAILVLVGAWTVVVPVVHAQHPGEPDTSEHDAAPEGEADAFSETGAVASAAEEPEPDALGPGPEDGPTPETVAAARQAFAEGIEALSNDRWASAIEAFRRSASFVERPSTYQNMAVALRGMGRLVEAKAAFERFLELEERPERRAAVERELARLRSRIATIVVRVEPEEATLELEGQRIEDEGTVRTLRVDPGAHRLSVFLPGYTRTSMEVEVVPGQRVSVAFSLERGGGERVVEGPVSSPDPARPAPEEPPDLVAPGIGLAVGGALFAVAGAVLTIIGVQDYESVENLADGDEWADYEAAHARTQWMTPTGIVLGAVGIVGLGLGGALIGVGVSEGPVTVAIGPGSIRTRVSF